MWTQNKSEQKKSSKRLSLFSYKKINMQLLSFSLFSASLARFSTIEFFSLSPDFHGTLILWKKHKMYATLMENYGIHIIYSWCGSLFRGLLCDVRPIVHKYEPRGIGFIGIKRLLCPRAFSFGNIYWKCSKVHALKWFMQPMQRKTFFSR